LIKSDSYFGGYSGGKGGRGSRERRGERAGDQVLVVGMFGQWRRGRLPALRSSLNVPSSHVLLLAKVWCYINLLEAHGWVSMKRV
jgi:hypothetical protein